MKAEELTIFNDLKGRSSIARYVAGSMQLAMLLEVSAYPKPGNVHRTRDHSDMRFEHFLGAISGLYSIFYDSAKKGHTEDYKGKIGKLIFDAVINMLKWQTNGNTSLGTIILLVPLSIASGKALKEGAIDELEDNLKVNVEDVCEKTSYIDSLWLYKAIRHAEPGGLGIVRELDVFDDSSLKAIRDKTISLYRIFSDSASYDSVASEWVNGFDITFNVGYPFYVQMLKKYMDVNIATVNTFLKILAEKPDSLIIRKAGFDTAKKTSWYARSILDKGGMSTEKGIEQLWRLDRMLSKGGQKLNPGTTADLACSSISIATVMGFRP